MFNMKRIVCVLLTLALVASLCMAMTACGDKKDDSEKKIYTTVATQPATQAATQAALRNPTTAPLNPALDAQQPAATLSVDSEQYGGLTSGEATQNVLQSAGEGSYLLGYYQGTTPDGNDAWIVTVQTPAGEEAVYYSAYGFCYPAYDEESDQVEEGHGINDAYYANVSEQQAGQIALNNMGDDNWMIIASSQGSYEGVDAWVITIENLETGATRRAYVSGNDCYFG